MPAIVVNSLDSSMVSSLTFSFGRTKSTEPRTRDVLVSPSAVIMKDIRRYAKDYDE